MPHEAIAMPEGGLFLLLIVHVPLRTDFSRAPHAPGIRQDPSGLKGRKETHLLSSYYMLGT